MEFEGQEEEGNAPMEPDSEHEAQALERDETEEEMPSMNTKASKARQAAKGNPILSSVSEVPAPSPTDSKRHSVRAALRNTGASHLSSFFRG